MTMGLVVRDGMSMTMLGVTLGLAGAIGAQRVFAATLVGVERFDPQTMVVAAGLLSLVALIACYFPARRAASVDPCITLRAE
jgi:putative ABC transport system permease protein